MIGLVYGTRPEYIKVKPLVDELREKGKKCVVIQVAQHSSLLDGCEYDVLIPVEASTGNRLNDIMLSVLSHKLPSGLEKVVVQGDTTTGVAMAMNAFHNNIDVVHMEAGLRTNDKQNPFPEEVNRRMISALAKTHLCAREIDEDNLYREGFAKDDIHVTGNTVIDNLVGIQPSPGRTVLITLHRRENHEHIAEWFKKIEELANVYPEYDFVFPMHPNPNVQKHKGIFNTVTVIDPIPFADMKERVAACAAVITDSGGLQEECSFFQKRCFVCREVTERPCGSSMLCPTPKDLYRQFSTHHTTPVNEVCDFGNGDSAKIISEIL